MISINDNVTGYVDKLLDREEELNIKSYYLENQSTVIDCGVGVTGSIGAGILYSIISMGGLGKVSVVPGIIDSYYIHFTQVCVDRPAIACLGSQKPAWKLKIDGYTGTGYGPARALSQKPKAIYSAINYSDDAEIAIINIESGTLPTAKEMDFIAKQCSTEPECVVALVSQSNSIVGSIVNSTRTIEWAMNRLYQLGYDIYDVSSASSVTPISPVRSSEQEFIGSSFDSIAYYGMAHLYVKSLDERLSEITSDTSKAYGKGFKALVSESQGDFSKVDHTMFAPARVMVNGIQDGSLAAYGRLNADMLLVSYGLNKA